MYFEMWQMWLMFGLVILTGGTIILLRRIDRIFKNAREDTNPLNDYSDAMQAHDKEEAEN